MSTEGRGGEAASRSADGWGEVRIFRAPLRRSPPDAGDIAHTLIDRYGAAALPFARRRAARAIEIGDELALEAWRLVIEVTKRRLRRSVEP